MILLVLYLFPLYDVTIIFPVLTPCNPLPL